jgi:hypothetical protein
MNMDIQKKGVSKMNIFIIAVIIIMLSIYTIPLFIDDGDDKVPERKVVYCGFENNVSDELPRYECAVLKIITYDINSVDFDALQSLNSSTGCAYSLDDVDDCDADTYHFSKFPLKLFCSGNKSYCDVDGYVCGAYYITYYTDNPMIEFYEDGMFTENNISSKEELENKVAECDVI